MPFGLCNAPATYSRVMGLVLRGLTWEVVLAFLDDILVLGSSFDGHLATLERVFQRFRNYQLKLKPRKCELFQRKVDFLGRVVSRNGLEKGTDSDQLIHDWPIPRNTKEVERFLGLANYHRMFIKDYARMSSLCTRLRARNSSGWEETANNSHLTSSRMH